MKYLLLILIGLSGYKVIAQKENNGVKIINGVEEEYFYAFTEATKQLLFENFNQAISLYLNCLMYNKESNAIFYQLSRILFRIGRVGEAKYFGKQAAYGTVDNRWYWMNLISMYQITGDIDSAIVLSKEFISRFEEDYAAKINLGVLLESRGNYDLALTLYNDLEKFKGIEIELILRKYYVYSLMDRKRDALKELKKGRDYFVDNIRLNLTLAEHFSKLEEEDSAAIYYNYVLETEGTNSEVLLSYLGFLLHYGRLDEALYSLKEIISNNLINEDKFYDFFYDKFNNRNIDNLEKEILDSLINAYIELRNNDLRIKSLYLDYLIEKERYSEASQFIDDLLKDSEGIFRFWYQGIFVEFNLKNFIKVTEYGDLAIRKFVNEVMLYYYTGIAWQNLKDFEKAINYYDNGLKRTNRVELIVQFNALIGDCYFEMEKFDKCFEHYEKAYSYDTSNVMVRNNYAFYLSEIDERLDKAERLSYFAIEVEKRNFIYLDTYAWINYKKGNYKEAKRYIKKAIKYGGDSDKEILEHWKIIFSKKSNRK